MSGNCVRIRNSIADPCAVEVLKGEGGIVYFDGNGEVFASVAKRGDFLTPSDAIGEFPDDPVAPGFGGDGKGRLGVEADNLVVEHFFEVVSGEAGFFFFEFVGVGQDVVENIEVNHSFYPSKAVNGTIPFSKIDLKDQFQGRFARRDGDGIKSQGFLVGEYWVDDLFVPGHPFFPELFHGHTGEAGHIGKFFGVKEKVGCQGEQTDKMGGHKLGLGF